MAYILVSLGYLLLGNAGSLHLRTPPYGNRAYNLRF